MESKRLTVEGVDGIEIFNEVDVVDKDWELNKAFDLIDTVQISLKWSVTTQ